MRELTDHKAALDASAIVSRTDSTGRMTYVNDRFCEISVPPRGSPRTRSSHHEQRLSSEVVRGGALVHNSRRRSLARRHLQQGQRREVCTGSDDHHAVPRRGPRIRSSSWRFASRSPRGSWREAPRAHGPRAERREQAHSGRTGKAYSSREALVDRPPASGGARGEQSSLGRDGLREGTRR